MENITKYQLAAKCIYMMRKQLEGTNHPVMREYLTENINYFSRPGCVEQYKVIGFNNCLVLVHDTNYDYYSNFKLFSNNTLYISTFDDAMQVHGDHCIRINANYTADCARAVHGEMVGDSIKETLKYDQNGNEITYTFGERRNIGSVDRSNVVKNDETRGFFGRLFRNATIGRKEFIIVCVVLAILALIIDPDFNAVLDIKTGKYLTDLFVTLPFLFFVFKRGKDTGYPLFMVLLGVVLAYFLPKLMALILFFVPTGVITDSEYADEKKEEDENRKKGREGYRRRSDVCEYSLDWFTMNSAMQKLAQQLRAGNASSVPYDDPSPSVNRPQHSTTQTQTRRNTDDDRREEEERAAKEERKRDLRSRISVVQSLLSGAEYRMRSAENSANSSRLDGDTYSSYANSESDPSRRADYMQSAESRYDDAARYENEARNAEREVDSLRSDLENLWDELNRL